MDWKNVLIASWKSALITAPVVSAMHLSGAALQAWGADFLVSFFGVSLLIILTVSFYEGDL